MYKKKLKKNKKFICRYNVKKYFKNLFYLKKNFNDFLIFNIFFNINDINDDLFYLYYDVFNWDSNKKWFLFKPHYLSFFYFLGESLKWIYIRYINRANKVYKNISVFLLKDYVNVDLFLISFKFKQLKLRKKISCYYFFKSNFKKFKFKQYYFFFNKKNLFFFNREPNINTYLYIFIFLKWNYNYKILKKNNTPYIYLKYKYYFNYLNSKINFFKYLRTIYLLNFLFFSDNNPIIFFYYLVEEKQKFKNFLSKFNNYIFNVRTLQLFLRLIAKKRLRKKKNEKKLILKKKNFLKKKRRTNNQILRTLIKKYILRKQLYRITLLHSSYYKLKKYLFLLFYNKYFFFNFKYQDTLFLNLDYLYSYYLPKNKKIYFLNSLNDDYAALWRGNFKKQNFILNILFNIKKLNNFLGDIRLYNNVNIKNIYFQLLKKKYMYYNRKKKYFLFKNILIFLRFYKNSYLVLKNLDFIFNIYFWVSIFLNQLKKSQIINFKQIVNMTSFLNLIQILYQNKYNWFNLHKFDLSLTIITFNNFIVQLKCNFNFLLQEVCLYLYVLIFNLKPLVIFEKNDLNNKLKKLKLLKNIQYIFKGNISFENNYVLCLNLIKNSVQNSYFFDLLLNFFFNCKNSVNFIKYNLKLYWTFLELIYSLFDKFNINLLINLNINKKIIYLRHKNIVLYCATKSTKDLLESFLKNFVLYFLYYYLNFYFFFCIWINLYINNFSIFGYIIYLNKVKLNYKIDNFEIYKLLFFYNFLQLKNKQILIKPNNFLLNYPIIRIINYFLNIWLELLVYYNNLKILKFKQIFIRICFLIIYLKLKKKQKIVNFLNFKKILKFKLLFKNKSKKKELKKYILKNNKVNLNNNFLKKN